MWSSRVRPQSSIFLVTRRSLDFSKIFVRYAGGSYGTSKTTVKNSSRYRSLYGVSWVIAKVYGWPLRGGSLRVRDPLLVEVGRSYRCLKWSWKIFTGHPRRQKSKKVLAWHELVDGTSDVIKQSSSRLDFSRLDGPQTHRLILFFGFTLIVPSEISGRRFHTFSPICSPLQVRQNKIKEGCLTVVSFHST